MRYRVTNDYVSGHDKGDLVEESELVNRWGQEQVDFLEQAGFLENTRHEKKLRKKILNKGLR